MNCIVYKKEDDEWTKYRPLGTPAVIEFQANRRKGITTRCVLPVLYLVNHDKRLPHIGADELSQSAKHRFKNALLISQKIALTSLPTSIRLVRKCYIDKIVD